MGVPMLLSRTRPGRKELQACRHSRNANRAFQQSPPWDQVIRHTNRCKQPPVNEF